MARLINVVLFFAAILGLAFLIQQQNVLGVLRAEHDRLSDRFGVLKIENPDKFRVLRMDTGDPLDFVWRVYRPPVHGMQYRVTGIGGSSSGSSSSGTVMNPEESI